MDILIVDDDKAICGIMKEFFQVKGWGVHIAEEGKKGLEKFLSSENKPDIVITDLKMPEMGGLEFMEGIVGECPDTPVIMMSGYGDMEDVVRAMNLGCYDYLPKPFELDLLYRTVLRAKEKIDLKNENERYRLNLEQMVRKKTEELENMNRHLKAAIHTAGVLSEERRQAYGKLERSERKYRKLFEKSSSGILTIDANYSITGVNPAFAKMTGFDSHKELENTSISIHPSLAGSALFKNIIDCFRNGDESCHSHELTGRDGKTRYLKYSLNLISEGSLLNEVLCSVEDITQIMKENSIDRLTSLINQSHFQSTVEKAIARAEQRGENLAFIQFDIDNFKQINTRFQQLGGDQALEAIGRRIVGSIDAEKDYGIRNGGDEMCVLISGYPKKSLPKIVKSLFNRISRPYAIKLSSSPLNITFSAGVVEYSGQNFELLYSQAVAAASHSKAEGKNRYSFFNRSMRRVCA